jgi:hypothetical protein
MITNDAAITTIINIIFSIGIARLLYSCEHCYSAITTIIFTTAAAPELLINCSL